MITMEEINTIITNAFNYYNGRINVFNIAKLEINFMDLPSSSNGGESLSPNIVRIYPNIIRRYYTLDILNISFHISFRKPIYF